MPYFTGGGQGFLGVFYVFFFRTSKFSLVKEQLVEFNQLAIEHANGHEDMLNRVMTKVGEGCVFTSYTSPKLTPPHPSPKFSRKNVNFKEELLHV